MTDEQHNTYIAYSFLAHGAFQLLMLGFIIVMMMLMMYVPVEPGQPEFPVAFFGFLIAVMFLFQMAFTVPSFIAAYGLLKQKSWARVASIVASVIAAMSVPIGTAACIYSMWFFLGDRWKSIYESGDRNETPAARQLEEGIDSDIRDFESTENERDAAFQYREPPDWR